MRVYRCVLDLVVRVDYYNEESAFSKKFQISGKFEDALYFPLKGDFSHMDQRKAIICPVLLGRHSRTLEMMLLAICSTLRNLMRLSSALHTSTYTIHILNNSIY
jgi:hypothetical protein